MEDLLLNLTSKLLKIKYLLVAKFVSLVRGIRILPLAKV